MTFAVRGEEEVTGSRMRSLNVFKNTTHQKSSPILSMCGFTELCPPSVSCFALIKFSKNFFFMFETNRFGTHNRSDF